MASKVKMAFLFSLLNNIYLVLFIKGKIVLSV